MTRTAIDLLLAPSSHTAITQDWPGPDNHGADLRLVKSIPVYGSASVVSSPPVPWTSARQASTSRGSGTFRQEAIARSCSTTVCL